MVAMHGIAAGMQYVHSKRICHGDLNPSNVLVKVRVRAFQAFYLQEISFFYCCF
jgi:tRNA A-37 threonylcarbamoyl transferase component Bud32